jgi:hypothetical protein
LLNQAALQWYGLSSEGVRSRTWPGGGLLASRAARQLRATWSEPVYVSGMSLCTLTPENVNLQAQPWDLYLKHLIWSKSFSSKHHSRNKLLPSSYLVIDIKFQDMEPHGMLAPYPDRSNWIQWPFTILISECEEKYFNVWIQVCFSKLFSNYFYN